MKKNELFRNEKNQRTCLIEGHEKDLVHEPLTPELRL